MANQIVSEQENEEINFIKTILSQSVFEVKTELEQDYNAVNLFGSTPLICCMALFRKKIFPESLNRHDGTPFLSESRFHQNLPQYFRYVIIYFKNFKNLISFTPY